MGIDSPLDSFSVSLNKRLKTVDSNSSGEFNLFESHDGGVIDSRRKQSESEDDSEASICGICLCDNENAVRGKIDSCDHFFCFVCIMEWAKVESRCPMCKRRFTAIHRSPKPGVFPSERLVHVVQRDQLNLCTSPFLIEIGRNVLKSYEINGLIISVAISKGNVNFQNSGGQQAK